VNPSARSTLDNILKLARADVVTCIVVDYQWNTEFNQVMITESTAQGALTPE